MAAWTRIAAGSGPAASRPRGPGAVAGRVQRRRQLDRDHRVGARRQPAPGRDPHGRTGFDAGRRRGPGRRLAGDAEADGLVLRRRRQCRRRGSRSRPSRSCPTAAATSRPPRLGQHPADGVDRGHPLGGSGPAIAARTWSRASSTLSSLGGASAASAAPAASTASAAASGAVTVA